MRVLQGIFPANEIQNIKEATRIIFGEYINSFVDPESVIIYEQHMMGEEKLLSLCQKEYDDPNIILSTPKIEYIPRDILNEFKDKQCVPISYDVSQNSIVVGVIPTLARPDYGTIT